MKTLATLNVQNIVWDENHVLCISLQDLGSNLENLVKYESIKDDEIDIDSFTEDLTQSIVQAADVMVKTIRVSRKCLMLKLFPCFCMVLN